MEPKKFKKTRRDGPEGKIQDDLIAYLRARDWVVLSTHGNIFQFGFPDLYCANRMYGTRWVEVKNPLAYSFTNAQNQTFPMLHSAGVGIWILTAATEHEYQKLFAPANWWHFIGKSKV